MAGQKEKIKEPTTPKDPYWKQVRSTKKDAGPTIGELAFGVWKGLADLGSLLWTGKTTMVRGAIRKRKNN